MTTSYFLPGEEAFYATYANMFFVPSTRSMYSFSSNTSIAFLMSGILGIKRCEICEMTSWIKVWFDIVFRAFMILGRGNERVLL